MEDDKEEEEEVEEVEEGGVGVEACVCVCVLCAQQRCSFCKKNIARQQNDRCCVVEPVDPIYLCRP